MSKRKFVPIRKFGTEFSGHRNIDLPALDIDNLRLEFFRANTVLAIPRERTSLVRDPKYASHEFNVISTF